MKKIASLLIFLTLVSMALAQTPNRVVVQQLQLDPEYPVDILDYVTNTGITHSEHYILRVLHVETNELRGTDLGAPVQQIRIAKVGTDHVGWRVVALFNQSCWPAVWPMGTHLKIMIWHTHDTGLHSGVEPYPNYEYVEKTIEVPAGGGLINLMADQADWLTVPPSPMVSITVNSNYPGAAIYKDGVATGQVTPYTFTGLPDEISGVYSVVLGDMAWTPANYYYDGLEVETINFLGVLTPDSWSSIGTGTAYNDQYSPPVAYGGYYKNAREQYIITAAELTEAGAQAGMISYLRFNVADPNGCADLPNYSISMGTTNVTEFADDCFLNDLTEVFFTDSYTPTPSWNTYQLTAPFHWDGASNIVIQTSFDMQAANTSNASTYYTTTTAYQTLYFCSDSVAWDTVSTGTLSYNRPNMMIGIAAQPSIVLSPPINVETGFGIPAQSSFVIHNDGDQYLSFNIVSQPISEHLVSYFPFNGGPQDVVNPGESATVIGATLCPDRFGNPESAYYFDGNGSYLHLGQRNMGLDWTVNLFVTLLSTDIWQRFFDAHHFLNGVSGYSHSDPDICFTVSDYWTSGLNWHCNYRFRPVFHESLPVVLDETMMITTTVSSNGMWSMYLNGQLFSQGSDPNDPGTYLRDLFLGTDAGVTSFFNGIIDEFMLFDTELNQTEVAALWDWLSSSQSATNFAFTGFSPASGIIPPSGSQEINFTLNYPYSIGTHNHTIEVNSNDPLYPTSYQQVILNVLPPEIAADEAAIDVYLDRDNVVDNASVQINNLGPGILTFSNSWITADGDGGGYNEDAIPGFVFLGSLDGHTYYMSQDACTWPEAYLICEQLGGHLVTISSAEENQFISNFVHEDTWIGFTDEREEGVWEWVTGEEVIYTNWRSDEPNNSGEEDYAQMDSDGYWNDCSDWELRFVLEFSGSAYLPKITVNPKRGTLMPGQTATVVVSCDGSNTVDGEYSGFLRIASNATDGMIQVPITIHYENILPHPVTDLIWDEDSTDAHQVSINWANSAAIDSVETYNIYRKGKYETYWRKIAAVEGDVTSFSDRNFTPMDSTWVKYRIKAENRIGEGPASNEITASLYRFLAPTNVEMQIQNSRHVHLNWNPVTMTISGISGTPSCYIIYKSNQTESLEAFDFLDISFTNEYVHNWAAFFQPVNRLFYIVTAYGGDVNEMRSLLRQRPQWKFGELNALLQELQTNK